MFKSVQPLSCAFYVDSSWSLFCLFDIKGDFVAWVEVGEIHVYACFLVEEDVLRLALNGDKPEWLTLYNRFDCSVHFM